MNILLDLSEQKFVKQSASDYLRPYNCLTVLYFILV